MSIDTLESILRKVNLYSDYGEDEGMSVEKALEALNLYIEGREREARIDELKLTNNGLIGFEAERASYLPKDHDKTKSWPIVNDGVIIYSRHYYWSRIKELQD